MMELKWKGRVLSQCTVGLQLGLPPENLTQDRKDFEEPAADGALPLAWASPGSKPLRVGCFPVGHARLG